MKIRTSGGRLITRGQFFRENRKFHENMARLPFEEKVKILVELRKTDSGIRMEKNESTWSI